MGNLPACECWIRDSILLIVPFGFVRSVIFLRTKSRPPPSHDRSPRERPGLLTTSRTSARARRPSSAVRHPPSRPRAARDPRASLSPPGAQRIGAPPPHPAPRAIRGPLSPARSEGGRWHRSTPTVDRWRSGANEASARAPPSSRNRPPGRRSSTAAFAEPRGSVENHEKLPRTAYPRFRLSRESNP